MQWPGIEAGGEGLANNRLNHRLALKIIKFKLISLIRYIIELLLIIQECKKWHFRGQDL
jgi:hypothetical protein